MIDLLARDRSTTPQVLDGGAGGKSKRAKGREALANTADNALTTARKVGKGSGGSGFLVQDSIRYEVEVLMQTCADFTVSPSRVIVRKPIVQFWPTTAPNLLPLQSQAMHPLTSPTLAKTSL